MIHTIYIHVQNNSIYIILNIQYIHVHNTEYIQYIHVHNTKYIQFIHVHNTSIYIILNVQIIHVHNTKIYTHKIVNKLLKYCKHKYFILYNQNFSDKLTHYKQHPFKNFFSK